MEKKGVLSLASGSVRAKFQADRSSGTKRLAVQRQTYGWRDGQTDSRTVGRGENTQYLWPYRPSGLVEIIRDVSPRKD